MNASHLAERHGLVVIIALGESIVASGSGPAGLDLDAGLIAGALLGVAVAAALWWAYFDFVALIAAARRCARPRPTSACGSRATAYTYLHLPMVAGIVLFALGDQEDAGPHRRASSRPCRRSRCAAAWLSTCSR